MAPPLFQNSGQCGAACGEGLGGVHRRALKAAHQRQSFSGGAQHKTVRAFPFHCGRRLPGNADGVTVAIQFAGDIDALRRVGGLCGAVPFRVRPIGGVHVAGAVGKLERDGEWSVYRDGQQVARGMAAGLDHDFTALIVELAAQDAGPQVECLFDVADRCRVVDQEADFSQMQPVGIFAEPVV